MMSSNVSITSEQTRDDRAQALLPGTATEAPPPPPPSLRRNYIVMVVGNVVYAGCQWAMLMVLAKLTHPEQVGQFSLGLAITAPVILFTGLQLRGIQATDAHERFRFGDYLQLRVLCTLFALIVIALLGFLGHYDHETRLVILVIGVAKAIESLSDIYYGFFQQFERMSYIAVSMSIKGLASIVALGWCVFCTRRVLVGCIALGVTWLIVFLCYYLPNAGRLARILRGAQYRRLLAASGSVHLLCQLAGLALPLGGVMMLISLSANIPRYYLELYRGQYAVGIFSALYYLLVAGTTVIGALGQAAAPRLAHYYADGQIAAFYLHVKKLLLIGVLLGIAGIVVAVGCGPLLLRHLFRAEYARYPFDFTLIMGAAVLMYLASFLGFALTAARVLLMQFPLMLVVTLTTLFGSWWLIPREGIRGACYTLLIASAVQLLGALLLLLHAAPPWQPAKKWTGH